MCWLQALTLRVSYITLLGNIHLSSPKYVGWVFSAASLAFCAVISDLLSLDCLLSRSTKYAVQRVIIHLIIAITVVLLLMASQTLW